MSEMVERVARQLAMEVYGLSPKPYGDFWAYANRSSFERYARAVISIMREPTSEMEREGDNLSVDNYESWCPADIVWRTMIDTALATKSAAALIP